MKVKIQIKIQILALHGDDGENFDGKCLISKSKLWLIKYHTKWESDRSYLSWNLLPGVSHSFPHTNSTIHSPILFTTPKTVCIQYDPNVKANMDTKKTWRNTRRMSDDLAPNKSYWVISYSELDLVWVCRHLTRSIWKSNDARVYTVARPKAHTERERDRHENIHFIPYKHRHNSRYMMLKKAWNHIVTEPQVHAHEDHKRFPSHDKILWSLKQ